MSSHHTRIAPRGLRSRSAIVIFVLTLVTAIVTAFGSTEAAAQVPVLQVADADVNASSLADQDAVHRLFTDLFRGAAGSGFAQEILDGTAVHTPTRDSVGPAGVIAYVDRLRSFYAEGEFVITNVMRSGNIVVVQWAIVVHPDGTYGDPAADGPIWMPGTAVMRLGDGTIAEMWIQLDPPGEQASSCSQCHVA